MILNWLVFARGLDRYCQFCKSRWESNPDVVVHYVCLLCRHFCALAGVSITLAQFVFESRGGGGDTDLVTEFRGCRYEEVRKIRLFLL